MVYWLHLCEQEGWNIGRMEGQYIKIAFQHSILPLFLSLIRIELWTFIKTTFLIR